MPPWPLALTRIFGPTDYPGRCQCQRFKVLGWSWRDSTQEERTAMLLAQTACGDPNAAGGLGRGRARTSYPKPRTSRVPGALTS